LYSEQHLLHGDGGPPSLFLVQDGEADGSGRVDVWVEERGDELALGWLRGVFVAELHRYFVYSCGVGGGGGNGNDCNDIIGS